MIMKDDIHETWTAEDIALFAGVVGAVQAAIKDTVLRHERGGDAVLPIVSKAALIGIKGLVLESGLRADKTSIPAFNKWVDLLKAEITAAPDQCREFEHSLRYHGRA
jgi:hypothetical protein